MILVVTRGGRSPTANRWRTVKLMAAIDAINRLASTLCKCFFFFFYNSLIRPSPLIERSLGTQARNFRFGRLGAGAARKFPNNTRDYWYSRRFEKKKKRSPARAVSVFAESATRDPITKVDNSGIERGLCGEQTISQTPFDGEIKFKRDPRSVLPRNST